MSTLSDTGGSTVGVKHCGEPEECSCSASKEAIDLEG